MNALATAWGVTSGYSSHLSTYPGPAAADVAPAAARVPGTRLVLALQASSDGAQWRSIGFKGLPQQLHGGAGSALPTFRGRLARALWRGWDGSLDNSMWVVHLADKLLEVSREGLRES